MSNNPDWKAKLQAIIDMHNHRHAKRAKDVSHRTQAARAEALFVLFKLWRALGFELDPNKLDGTHVKYMFWYLTCDPRIKALCDRRHVPMLPKPHSAAYLQFLASTLRTFSEWIGKSGLVLPPERYGIDPALFARTYVAQQDKSWTAHDVDIPQMLARVARIDERVAIMLELVWRFGLRRKEAVMFQPHLAVVPAGLVPVDGPVAEHYIACLSIERGTKGGRLRLVPLVSDAQRDVIERAKRFAPYPTSYLGHPGKTLLQALDRYKNVLSQAGITKKELGITGHGLRHQFAGDKYFDLANVACPVRGGEPMRDPELMERVLRAVSEQLGHSRPNITTAYCGKQPGTYKAATSPAAAGLPRENRDQ
ncbi:integrase domain-containing protein [Noviherbaspirillum sp.]|jgi:integrase|uniref:integrase domain-containing protein n=1 Tax=Noviherbaspirillum sp. TaxID=1926288 RepID=UPI0025CE1672|nr:integrase domain-containing protein [Noviherbaspirillum sp.]